MPNPPAAHATTNDFSEYTEKLPPDLTHALKLVRRLDETYHSTTNSEVRATACKEAAAVAERLYPKSPSSRLKILKARIRASPSFRDPTPPPQSPQKHSFM